jgi:hypothetical protein
MTEPDPARSRVAILLLFRLVGAGLLAAGFARWVKGGGEPDPGAAVIMMVGFILLLVVPMLLMRRWKGLE